MFRAALMSALGLATGLAVVAAVGAAVGLGSTIAIDKYKDYKKAKAKKAKVVSEQ